MKMSDANKDQTKEQVVSTEQQYDDNWYQVDFIVNKRLNLESGKLEYRTRWLGYTEQDDTWEPAENLVGYGGLWWDLIISLPFMFQSHLNCVMEFEQKLKEKKREEAQKKRTSKASRPRKTSVLGIPDAKRKKKEELQVPTADTTTVTATDTAPDTSTASLPSFAEEFSTGAKQDQVHEEVQQEKVILPHDTTTIYSLPSYITGDHCYHDDSRAGLRRGFGRGEVERAATR